MISNVFSNIEEKWGGENKKEEEEKTEDCWIN
jgi:hypothetical protein